MMDMSDPSPQPQGHVFVNPINPSSFMGMLCYKNGSLIRQKLRDKHSLTWDEFGNVLQNSAPTNLINICYDYEEITPPLKGHWLFNIEDDGTFKELTIRPTLEIEIRSLIDTQVQRSFLHIVLL